MDIFSALNRQLDFIRLFYFTAPPPFEALLRKYMPHYEACDEQPGKATQDCLRKFIRADAIGYGSQKAKESRFD
jgi:hypothetical protein